MGCVLVPLIVIGEGLFSIYFQEFFMYMEELGFHASVLWNCQLVGFCLSSPGLYHLHIRLLVLIEVFMFIFTVNYLDLLFPSLMILGREA